MIRGFKIIALLCTALLTAVVIVPLVSAFSEMLKTSMIKPPDRNELLFSALLSAKTATISALLSILFGIPAAWLLARKNFRGKIIIDTILDLPLVISPIAIGAMLIIFFRTEFGQIIDDFLGPFIFEVRGIIVAQFVVVIGLAVRLMKSVFEEIDSEYELIARTLGCTEFSAIRRITLPMAKRGIGAAFLLVWARALGEFGATVTLAGAMPGKTSTIPVAIYLSYGIADTSSMIALILLAAGFAFVVLLGMRFLGKISLVGGRTYE